MTPQTKLYEALTKSEAIKAMLEGKKVRHKYFASDEWVTLTPSGLYLFEDGNTCLSLNFWQDRRSAEWENDWFLYEQEQPEAIAGENQSALGFIESEYGKTWTNPYFGWSTDDVVDAMSEYASQQTSAKDKEIAELKEAISELIQVKDWKDKYGKDEHYLKAMPIAWENVRKLIQK